MHILLIHQAFATIDEPGGTRHHEFARYLTTYGHDVTIIASPVSYLTGETSQPDTERKQNTDFENQKVVDQLGKIKIIRAYTYPALHRSFIHRVISFLSFMFSSFLNGLKVSRVDLVWGTSPPIFQGATAWALARLKRVPFLFEVRDLWPAFAVAVDVLNNTLVIRASEMLESFLYRRADEIVVNSPGYIKHIKDRGGREAILIPNGADPLMFDPGASGERFRHDYGLNDKFVVLYAGAHGMSNDLHVLLDAADLLKQIPEIVFVLLGAGKEKKALQKRAIHLGLNNIRFLSPVSKMKMPVVLAASDVCVAILKSVELYKTVYPNKVFDYMAAGRPVILAIDGVIRDVVESADAGYFVPPGDPSALADVIRRAFGDPDMRQKMGNNGRRYVEDNFNRADLVGKLQQVMEEMFEGKSK